MSCNEKLDIVRVSNAMAARDFTTATGGNISVRTVENGCWITPSRLHKALVTENDLVLVDKDGQKISGDRDASSEGMLHLAVYRALPQAGAVIHAHPPYINGFAQNCIPIDTRSSSEAVFLLGAEVPVLPYFRPGTFDLADGVEKAVNSRQQAYLLANHGVICWGINLQEAYDILDTLELFARSLVISRILGGEKPLPPQEVQWLEDKYGEYVKKRDDNS